jgi:putative endonuclease
MPETGHRKGLLAELKAKSFLRYHGYSILAERFKTSLGEIDIVAKKGDMVIFVEVKLRKTSDAAAEAIHARNQSRVRNAAELYLQQYPEYNQCEMRFDALLLTPGAWPQHIEGAF